MISVFGALVWAQRGLTLPPAVAIVLAVAWTAFIIAVGAVIAYYNLLTASMAVGLCLGCLVAGLALNAVSELRVPANPRLALLLSDVLLPAFRAKNEGDKLVVANSGVISALAGAWIALIWSLVVSYVSDAYVEVTVAVQAGAFLLIVSVPLHNAVSHRNARWGAWRALRAHADALFRARDVVLSTERMSTKGAAGEIAELTMNSLAARTRRVPLASPSLLRCGPCARTLIADGTVQRPYYLVTGPPEVCGLFLQLAGTHDGVPQFARVAKGATVMLRRERVAAAEAATTCRGSGGGAAADAVQRCWALRVGERLLFSCSVDEHGVPPPATASWVAPLAAAAAPGDRVSICDAFVTTWEAAVLAAGAILATDVIMSAMALEEARMVARFDVELAAAARAQVRVVQYEWRREAHVRS